MNKQEMTKTVEEMKLKIKELEEQINREDNKGVWIPEIEEIYYVVDSTGAVLKDNFRNYNRDYYRLYNNNIFKTEEEAKKYAGIDLKYKKIVFELNQENPIDWGVSYQNKYYITFIISADSMTRESTNNWVTKGITYCTDKDILQKAIDLIGEKDLIWYIKR